MNTYDVVIIGSGMGGLICAAILGKEGMKVCVLEKNRQIGGSLQIYARDKVIFDSGVHYIGGLDKGQNLYQIFQYIGLMDRLHLQKMDADVFDKIIFTGDDHEYELAQGYENFIQKLLIHFPSEEKALRAYCDKIQQVCRKFPLYRLEMGEFYNEKEDVLEIDTQGFIASLTSNTRLRDVLAGNNSLYAGQPDKTPFYVHALVLNSYIESSWKCINGGSQIAINLSRIIHEQDGEIFPKSTVTRIVEVNGRVEHVVLASGAKIYAREFISDIHPVKTLELTSSDLIKKAYRNRLKSLENSVSSFTINIVLKKNSFKYFSYNYYCHDEGCVWTEADYTQDNWPLGYALFLTPSAKATEYADGMTLLAYMHYDEVKEWEGTFNNVTAKKSRGEAYENFKKAKAEKLIDKVEQKFPGFRNCIHSYYTATPLTYRDYIGNDDGSLYGIAKDYRNPLKTFISPKTKLPNLYLTGQNLNLHGILGVSVSALITCSMLVGLEPLLKKIRNA